MPSYVNDTNVNDIETSSDPSKRSIYDEPVPEHLRRGLSARQVQMIALAGTIGTGLFLGTGKSLAAGQFLVLFAHISTFILLKAVPQVF